MVQAVNSLEELVGQIESVGVEEAVKLHRKPPLPTRILRELYQNYHEQDRYLSFLAHYPLIPSDLAEQITSELDPEKVDIATGLAANPRCPQPSLKRLAEHPSAQVRLELAANPNLSPKEFQLLVTDDSEFVRAALAENKSLPNPIQFILAEDESSAVRIALAGRKTLDSDIAVHLASDPDPLVSGAIIINHSGDEELLQLWADQNQEQQQLLLLRRSKALPDTVLESLRLSPHPNVSRNALQDSALSGPEMLHLAQSDDTRDRLFLAGHTDLPASIQRLLAQDTSPKVRKHLANNPSIHESIAMHIVASEDHGAIRALAKNPAASESVLRELSLHPDDEVALLLAYREDLEPEHYDLLINHRESIAVAEHLAYQDINYTNLSEEQAQRLASHPAPSIRAFAAGAARLDSAMREQLIADPSARVRRRLAENTSLSEQQLRQLMNERDSSIAIAAEETYAECIRKKDTPNPGSASLHREREPEDKPRKGAFFNKIAEFFND